MPRKTASKLPAPVEVAISTESPCRITQRDQIVSRPNKCFDSRVVDVSGFGETQPTGQFNFKLSDFICPAGEVYSLPINVLATANIRKPIFLTVQHKLINGDKDVDITIFAWDANGAPVGGVPVNWRCRVEHPYVFL